MMDILECLERKGDPVTAAVTDFLAERFDSGLSHRLSMSAILDQHKGVDFMPIGQHFFLKRLMRGIFRSRSPVPRYVVIWDVGNVAKGLQASMLSLKWLTFKLAFSVGHLMWRTSK